MKVTFVRHGETDFNKKRIIQGRGIDSDLNKIGVKQSLELHEKLSNSEFDLLIASSLKRSQQTLKPFVSENLKLNKDNRIDEISWGIYEGKETTEILKEAYKTMINEWSKGNLSYAVQGGESCLELFDRLKSFLKDLAKMNYNNVLVCTHGRTLRALITIMRNESPSQMENYNPGNCEFVTVKIENSSYYVDISNVKVYL